VRFFVCCFCRISYCKFVSITIIERSSETGIGNTLHSQRLGMEANGICLQTNKLMLSVSYHTLRRYSTKLHSANSLYNFLAGLSNLVAHSTRRQSCYFAKSATSWIIRRPCPRPRRSGSMYKSSRCVSPRSEWIGRSRTVGTMAYH
jgi:hypothetical protein